MASEERNIEAELLVSMLLTNGIREGVEGVEIYESDCLKVGERADHLFQKLFYASCIATPSIYQRPLRRFLPELIKNLSRALKLIRKCGNTGILRHFTVITTSNFQEVYELLDASLADLNWIITVFEYSSSDQVSIGVGLPPMAAKKPILSLVWSFIASLQMGSLFNRIHAAKELSSFASENVRNKRIIVEEGVISPLLKLLKEGPTIDAQVAAASVLCSLATDKEAVQQIVVELGIPIIVQVLTNAAMRVQVHVASLVSIMAENNSAARDEFGRENAINSLVWLLSFEGFYTTAKFNTKLRSLPTINEDVELSSNMQYHEERENHDLDMKFKLRINCSKALRMLLKENTSNVKRIITANGLFCLAKHINGERGGFQLNCLMSVKEIAKVAEFNTDIQEALKINSDSLEAILDRLLRVIDGGYSFSFRIPAIKSIGSLSLMFPEKETKVISLLAEELEDSNLEVATEAIIALGKFACPENHLSMQHSKTIVASNGVPSLMSLVKVNENSMLHGLILLCYLALHKECSGALKEANVLSTLEFASHSSVAKNPLLVELIPKAIHHLQFYQAGVEPDMFTTRSRNFEQNVGWKTYMMLGCASLS